MDIKNKVDFLIIGAQKSGTTSLHEYLRTHDGIYLPPSKELHFFDKHHKKGYDYYHSKFEFNNYQMFGESTPMYLYDQECIKKIFNYNPDMKLVIMLRNPIERAYSLYNMAKKHNQETLTFSDAIRGEKNRLPSKWYSYVDRGLYFKQISNVLKFFEMEKIHFIRHEDYLSDQEGEISKVMNFIGVDPSQYKYSEQPSKVESRKYDISDSDRKYLLDIFGDDINSLEKLLKWNCENWT